MDKEVKESPKEILEGRLERIQRRREWRHFFRLRLGSGAHPQIQEISKLILEIFKQKLPVFFEDIF